MNMEELKLTEQAPMSEEEFEKYIQKKREEFNEAVANGVLFLKNYYCVSKFKSVRRAIRRGHMSVFGDIYPKRPFGNTRTSQNDLKRKIYEHLRRAKV